ncbi:MAG: phosphate/phosphite/phosphonate ABC transporter substrate-binding protein [Deltaproteobacteria bacterium]|nr:phosphate/phosphite/phosphonate ABC transporter substrate-binding protein [Deltaproteobacteria bacterium]
MSRTTCGALLVVSFSAWNAGCQREEPRRIELESARPAVEVAHPDARPVRFAVGGMITPKEGMGYYRDFLRYIQEKIGTKVQYVDREGYAEINDMLRSSQLEVAFVCSGPYVYGHEQFGLELLAAPQAYGATVYYSYIIVRKESACRAFTELRGARFAFTDPLSNTGKLVPTYMLARMNETPASFFKEIIFTRSHDKSIKAVAQGIVDAASVDSLIWEYLAATSPELTAKTRILEKSPPYAIPPVVVRRDLAPELKEKLRQAILNAHADPKGQAILRKMRIDRFVVIPDSAYDSVREMQSWVSRQEAGK